MKPVLLGHTLSLAIHLIHSSISRNVRIQSGKTPTRNMPRLRRHIPNFEQSLKIKADPDLYEKPVRNLLACASLSCFAKPTQHEYEASALLSSFLECFTVIAVHLRCAWKRIQRARPTYTGPALSLSITPTGGIKLVPSMCRIFRLARSSTAQDPRAYVCLP